jgi:inner membrane protein
MVAFRGLLEISESCDRSLKYAVPLVGLTFLAFFIVELVGGARLHVVQCTMIGAAQVLFYFLLLSLSEHLGFDTAYLITVAATIVLTSLYPVTALGNR